MANFKKTFPLTRKHKNNGSKANVLFMVQASQWMKAIHLLVSRKTTFKNYTSKKIKIQTESRRTDREMLDKDL